MSFFKVSGSDKESVEQKALDYFITQLDSYPLLCFNGGYFDKKKGELYLNRNCCPAAFQLRGFEKPSYTNKFFNIDFLLKQDKNILDSLFRSSPDNYIFSKQKYDFINLTRSWKKKVPRYSDLSICVCDPVKFNDFEVVVIRITCKSDWILQNVYIKMDNEGNPVSIASDGGYR